MLASSPKEQEPRVRANPHTGFDRGYLAVGAALVALMALGLHFHIMDLIDWDLMTLMLWLSVGGVMVMSRINGGRWE